MLGIYLQIDSLIDLNVHTDKTLAMIEEELLVFGDELKVSQLFYPSECHDNAWIVYCAT